MIFRNKVPELKRDAMTKLLCVLRKRYVAVLNPIGDVSDFIQLADRGELIGYGAGLFEESV